MADYRFRLMVGASMDDGAGTRPYRAIGLFRCRWSSRRQRWTTARKNRPSA